VVRSRTFFNHSSPWEQTITEELTIHNENASESRSFVILEIPEFKEGLRVLDFDNSELAYYPRHLMREKILALRKKYNDLYVKLINALEKGQILWIILPEDKIINAKELRVLRLVYHYREDAAAASKFFDTPLFSYRITISANQGNTYFFVKAPVNYELHFKRGRGENVPQGVYELTKKSIISIMLPAANTPFSYSFGYEVGLRKSEQAKWIGATVGLSLLAIILTISIPLEWIDRVVLTALGTAILTISTAMLALLNDPMTQKTKWYLLFPIGLAILLITLSSSASQDIGNSNMVTVYNSTYEHN
jgi:hypothetical protein